MRRQEKYHDIPRICIFFKGGVLKAINIILYFDYLNMAKIDKFWLQKQEIRRFLNCNPQLLKRGDIQNSENRNIENFIKNQPINANTN